MTGMHTLQRRGSILPDDLGAALGDYVVVDVRDWSEWERGHIPGSLHVPIDLIASGWSLDDLRLPIAVLGEGDDDAAQAAELLVERGIDAVAISGGVRAWRAARQCLVVNRR